MNLRAFTAVTTHGHYTLLTHTRERAREHMHEVMIPGEKLIDFEEVTVEPGRVFAIISWNGNDQDDE